MELIFHIIAGIQHQMHFGDLFGCFGGDCQICFPVQGEPAAAPCAHENLQWCSAAPSACTALCVHGHLQHQNRQQKQPQEPPAAWMIRVDPLVEARVPGPLPAVAAPRYPPCPGPALGCPAVPTCWQQQPHQYLLQASCFTCWLFCGCWQYHTGIHTTLTYLISFHSCWHPGYMGPWSLWPLVQLPPLWTCSVVSCCCHHRDLGSWSHPSGGHLCIYPHTCIQNRDLSPRRATTRPFCPIACPFSHLFSSMMHLDCNHEIQDSE